MENKTKLEKYEEMQAMVRKEVENMFPNLFKQYATQFGVNKTPTHAHNGTDSNRIEAVNLQNNIKYGMGIQVIASGGPETVRLRTIPNLEKITLFGFAANNVSAPATKRAIINGHAAFGRCFTFDQPGAVITPSVPVVGINLLQGGNSMYIDSTSLTNNRVAFSSENIVAVVDNTGTTIITMTIEDWSNGVLTLTAELASDWQMFFSIIMS